MLDKQPLFARWDRKLEYVAYVARCGHVMEGGWARHCVRCVMTRLDEKAFEPGRYTHRVRPWRLN